MNPDIMAHLLQNYRQPPPGQGFGRPVQMAGAQEDIEKLLHQYATGGLSAGQVRKQVPQVAPGYSIDSLRGNSPQIPVYDPRGNIIWMGT